ncbi:MAG: hypothetical protein LYZ69_08430, partial [Nitrososphaerales archaeon]|nr:hypothetical protein [Nitrososphaerales archaeon]
LRQVEAVVDRLNPDCDLIDPRTLYPLDVDTICNSVSKTGALLVVEPDTTFAGTGAELTASVVEREFSSLKKPVRRLGAPRSVIPASQDLHKYMLPTDEEIAGAIKELAI